MPAPRRELNDTAGIPSTKPSKSTYKRTTLTRRLHTITIMEPRIVQVDVLVSLKDLPEYTQYHDLSDAQFFRLNVDNVEGPFAIITEVACLEDCYFAWKLIIERTMQPQWPKARIGRSCLSNTDVNEIFCILTDELARYQSGDPAIGDERITIFEHYEKPHERVAWCLKKCAGMSWVKIEVEANIKTEVDIKTEFDDSMEFGIKAEVKVKTESET